MKKNFLNFIITLICLTVAIPAFAEEITYKFVPVKDAKTKIEFLRAAVPTDFNVTSDVAWERNIENPAQVFVTAKNNDSSVMFFYSTEKSFVDVPSDKLAKLHAGKQDPTLRVFRKKFQTPEDAVFEIVNTTNDNVKDIKLISEKTCSDELSDYLIREMYGKISKIEAAAKTDKRSTKIQIINPYVKPYIATYSFSIGNKKYKQTFVTMVTSLDFEYAIKNTEGEADSVTKKLWKNTGFYSFRAEENKYDKYFDDFLVFVSDSMFNQKTVEAIDGVKMQMLTELKPTYADVYTGSSLRNMPSELFRRYYFGGKADYSEFIPFQKPNIHSSRWIVELFSPQVSFEFRKMSNLWRQKIYVPEKYKYVYYNNLEEVFIASTDKKELKGAWTTLKPSKINYEEKDNPFYLGD